jgi:phosphotransferase system HPr-like phosphotransfer protein
MTLAAERGSTMILKFDGPDAHDAGQAMRELFDRGFDEPM